MYFPDGFDWVKGGKLPGLCGSQCNTGGNVPTGKDGWSARLMWRSGASLVQYVYSAGQTGTWGTDLVWMRNGKPLVIETGKWHEVKVRICLNTPGTGGGPGAKNGRVTGWYDGVQAIDTIGFRFRDLDTMHIDQFYFSTFFGGNTDDFRPTKDERIFFDDFTVSDSFELKTPSATTPRPGAKPIGAGGRALRFEQDLAGQVLSVANLSGRSLARIPIESSDLDLPSSLPGGVVFVSVSGMPGGTRIFLP